MTIPVYSAEVKAGLAEQIQGNNSIAFDMSFEETLDKKIIDLGKSIATKNGAEQADLFYLDSVLVSVGWNHNDDVFDPLLTWAARNTPIDKPFNLGHDEDDIIGHMTASFVQSKGKVIPDDTLDSEVPDVFDIIVSSVIYSKKQNPESQAKVTELIDGIKNGNWCVSMECLFKDFDFALIGPDGSHRVVARDESSAHLTKHLRILGGDGVYNGNKVGRLLKNFAFSGKGLVERPANPRSIILNNFRGSQASLQEIEEASASEVTNISEKEEENTNMSEILQKQLDAANARIAELEAGRDKNHDAQIAAANDKISEQDGVIKAQEEKIADLEAQIEAKTAEANETVKAHDTAIAEKDATIKSLEDEKAAAEAARVAEARTNMLVEAGVDREEATAKVEMFAALDDEAFASYAKDMKDMKDKKDKEKKDGDKEKDAKAEETDEEGESQADESVIDNAEVEDTGTVKASEQTEQEELEGKLQSACASWLKFTPEEESK